MDYIDPEFKTALATHGLDDADHVWNLTLQRVDDPNRARGGWSEVGRYILAEPIMGIESLYIKRQENFTYRDWRYPLTTRPTLQREFDWLRWCQSNRILSLRPLAYSGFHVGDKQRAILITAGLDQHIPLTEIETHEHRAHTSVHQRRLLLKSIAHAVADMHTKNLQHRCLYSKHIFISRNWQQTSDPDIRMIDLEKARSLNWLVSIFGEGEFRDLDSLNRHAKLWTRSERMFFLLEYTGNDRSIMRGLYRKLGNSMKRALLKERVGQ